MNIHCITCSFYSLSIFKVVSVFICMRPFLFILSMSDEIFLCPCVLISYFCIVLFFEFYGKDLNQLKYIFEVEGEDKINTYVLFALIFI